jgi:hypothetical protein
LDVDTKRGIDRREAEKAARALLPFLKGMNAKQEYDAVTLAAKETGIPRARLFRALIHLRISS